MSRLATPPAEVPLLTDIVDPLSSDSAFESSSTPALALSQNLQKKIIDRVVQCLGKTLKSRLHEAGQRPGGMDRNQLVAFLCNEIEQTVADAVDHTLAQQARDVASTMKRQPMPVSNKVSKVVITKNNNGSG